MKEDIETNISMIVPRWFGHIERMRGNTKDIDHVDVSGNVSRECPSRTYTDPIAKVIQKDQMCSTKLH